MAKGDPRPPQKSSAAKPPPAMVRPAAQPVAHRPVTKPARTAMGSTPPAREPLTSRTKTLDDPLTTSLLAEVARRSQTIDVLPEQIDEVIALVLAEPDPDEST